MEPETETVSAETPFGTIARESAEKPVGVFRVGDLYYFAYFPSTESYIDRVVDTTRSQAARLNPKGCRTCCIRTAKYANLIGPNGPPLLYHMTADCRDEALVKLRSLVVEAAEAANVSNQTLHPFVVTNESFPSLLEGGFRHLTVLPAAVTDARKAKLFKRACEFDYVKMDDGTMLTGLVANLLSSKEMVASINIFDNCLKQTSHGAALYRATTDWILGIQKYAADTFARRFWISLNPLEKLHAVMYALGTSNLTKGANGASSIPNFHQANNSILGFLKNAHNEKAMIGLINDQSSPENYQRRTALREGQLDVGQSLLGNFSNSISRVSTLQTLYGDQFVGWSQRSDCDASSAAGFSALHKMFATKKASAALPTKAQLASEFATRCALKAPVITTIAQLMAVLTDGKPHTLTVDASYHAPWVLVDTTLSTEMLRPCQKHLWGVFNRSEARVWGASSNTRVLGVFRMPMGQLMFLLEGLNLPANLGNFNFPEFLAAHMHAAKAAFEALNKITTAVVPPLANGDFYAAGICASPQTSRRILSKNIDIVLDGVKHTLTSFD